MATELEQLVVSLEARIKNYENELKKARQITERQMKAVEQSTSKAQQRVEANMARLSSSIQGHMGRALAGVSTAAAVAVVQKLADEWTNAGNKIVAAGVPLDQQASTLEQISLSAERARTSFSSTADLYARLTRSSKDLNASQAEVAVATETVAKALKLAGASAGETESTLVQLGQGLSSGKLQGDELRSLLENAPVVAQAIAKEFGVAVGELKTLGAEGKLTSDRVFKGIVSAASEVNGAFAKTKATGQDAFTAIETAATRYVGQSSTVAMATGAISSAAQLLANNFGVAADGAVALGTVIAARLIGQGLTPAAVALGSTVAAAARASTAMNALNATLLASQARMSAAAAASRALAVVGGPVGAAILAVSAAAVYFSSESAKAAERSRQYAAALEEVRTSAQESGKAIDEHTEAVIRAAKAQAEQKTNELNKGINEATNDAARFEAQIKQTLAGYSAFSSAIRNPEDVKSLQNLARGFDGSAESALKTKEEIFRLANSNPNFQEIADRLKPILDNFAGAITLVRKLRTELKAVGSETADATSKAIERAIPNPTTGNSYSEATQNVANDPVIRALQGQAALQRSVAEAEMGETAKKIRDTRQKLFDEITKAGGTVDPKALELAATRIVNAEEAKRGKSDDERDADRVKQFTESLAAERAEVEAEAAALGKSNLERQIAINLARAGAAATDEQKQAIIDSTTAIYNAEEAIKKYEQAQEEANRTAEYFGDVALEAITDLALEGRSLDEVFQNVAKSLARAALQAAILGQGPLAGLFGTSGQNGALGGLVGLITSAFSGKAAGISFNPTGRAQGGQVKAGTAYTVGEFGRETFVPTTPGQIIPHNKTGGSNVHVSITQAPGVKVTRGPDGPQGPTFHAQIDDMVANALMNGSKTAGALKMWGGNKMRGR